MEEKERMKINEQMQDLLLYMQHRQGGNEAEAKRIAQESEKKNVFVSSH